MTQIRLIALDIDGTLMNRAQVISEPNVSAIKKAQEAGKTVVIASGRSPGNIYFMMQEYGIRCPMIAVNGGQITDETMQIIHIHPMKRNTAEEIRLLLSQYHADYYMVGVNVVCTSSKEARHHSELQYGEMLYRIGQRFLHGEEEIKHLIRSEEVLKYYINPFPGLEELRNELMRIPETELSRSGEHNIEIMAKGCNKGEGLRVISDYFGIPVSSTMAVGDELNDLPILNAAGISVAMGNACEEVRRFCRHVTADNDHDGVATAINDIAFAGKQSCNQ